MAVAKRIGGEFLMAEYKVSGANLTSVADAIRTKGGTSAALSFPAGFVSAIGNIPTGGGSTLITKTITVNGTYDAQDDDADGYSEVTVNVPSTSGSIVTGTFTGSAAEKGTAKAITVPYSGNGYPVWLLIYPTAGAYKSGTDIYSSTQYKAVLMLAGVKCDVSLTPDYIDSVVKNQMAAVAIYKNSSTDATNVSTTANKTAPSYYRYSASGSTGTNTARFYNSGTNLTVYIAPDGGTEYGFLAGTEYTYVIRYSE